MQPGDVVAERFEIERTAGSGGMGVVYRALDRTNGAPVALKLLRQIGDVPVDRFAREVSLLSGLEHPHIVGYVSHGVTSDQRPYLVMPWLDGEDLHQRLRLGPLGVDETLTIAQCVAGALGCLHRQGLVHRDLKPSNLFLPKGSVGDVKVIDLGIARQIAPAGPMTVSGVLLGTPGYMAPEEARGDHVVAPTMDIFALGCVLHECLTGKPLFTGSHVMAVLAKIILEEAPRVRELRPEVPVQLDAIVHRMVAKDPARRPRDGDELTQWLADLWRVPLSSRSTPLSMALGAREQRVVTVLMAALPRALAPSSDATDSTRRVRPNFEAVSSASVRFGVRVHPLADGTAIALAPDNLAAADQASLLARFGRHLVELVPAASVAMATGMAVTGGKLPVGEAIERGVRIARSAAPGRGVHVDDVSAALIATRFDVRREGESLIVDDERHALDASRPLLGKPTSCIGRDRELAVLDATLGACIDRAGPSVVLVTAPAGTGKSRLRHELVRRLRPSEGPWQAGTPKEAALPVVLQSSGDPLSTGTPYALVAEAVRQAAGLREGEPRDLAHRKLAEHVMPLLAGEERERAVEFLGELVGAPFDDEGRLQLRVARQSAAAMTDQIRSAFEAIVRAWCEKAPVVLVLEDMHWADQVSIKLIDGVLRKLQGSRLLVLALARPEVHERFPGLWVHRNVTEIRLPPLAERVCERIVRDAMGDAGGKESIGRIVARSEGNAFFLEELIRAAVEGDRSSDVGTSSLGRGTLPESVLAVAQARLERLDADSRRVLRAASVFGESFPLEGVAVLVGKTPSDAEPILNALIQNEMVVPCERPHLAGARELAFRHELLRGAAYATLTDDDRVLGHRLAAGWLEDANEDLEVVALHWLEARDRGRAAECFARAAEAHWAHAYADAAARCIVRSLLVADPREENAAAVVARTRLLGDVLEATRGIDARDVTTGIEAHFNLPMKATDANPRWGIVHAALARSLSTLRDAADIASATESLAHAGYALGALFDFPAARELLGEAASRLPGDDVRLRTVWMAGVKVASREGDFGRALELLSRVELSGDAHFKVEMLAFRALAEVAVRGREGLAPGLDDMRRAEKLVAAGGANPVLQVLCSKMRLMCLFFAGEYGQGVGVALSGAELARQSGLGVEQSIHLHMLAELYIRLGENTRGRHALAVGYWLASDRGESSVPLLDEVLIAHLDGLKGDEAAAGRIGAIANHFREVGHPWAEIHCRYWLGRLLVQRRDARALPELERALDLARGLRIRLYEDDCVKAIAELARAM